MKQFCLCVPQKHWKNVSASIISFPPTNVQNLEIFVVHRFRYQELRLNGIHSRAVLGKERETKDKTVPLVETLQKCF